MTYAQCLERLVTLIYDWRKDERREFPEAVLQRTLLLLARDPALLARNPTITSTPEGAIRLRWWEEVFHRYGSILIESPASGEDTGIQ